MSFIHIPPICRPIFFDQIGLKDPATSLMENIIDLHHFIFFYVLIISGLVLWLLVQIIDNFVYLSNLSLMELEEELSGITNSQEMTLENILMFNLVILGESTRKFKDNKILEASWTLFPAVILIMISIPSFYMLYLSEETITTLLSVKAVGFQWYWCYDYTSLFPFTYNRAPETVGTLDKDDYLLNSYMEPAEYLNFKNGDFRLLETDDILVVPTNLHLRILVSSMDTLHSFAMPTLGLKIDAIPGRLNKMDLFIFRMGSYFGQCSELCGIGHG